MTAKCWSCGADDTRQMAFVEKPGVYVLDLCEKCRPKEAFADSMTEVRKEA